MTLFKKIRSLPAALIIAAAVFAFSPHLHAAGENIGFLANIGGAMRACIMHDTTVYALEGPRLVIVDISAPSAPVTLGTLNLPGIGRRLARQGDTLYITCWDGGLVTVSVSDPAAPRQLGQIVFDTSAEEKNCKSQGVGVQGNYAYVADQVAGFITLDVSDPAEPVIVDTFKAFAAPNYNAYDVNIVGDTLFLACEFDGLYIFDLSDPARPARVSHYPTDMNDPEQPRNFYKTVLDGTTLYVGGGGGGLVIMDVTDLSAPELVYYDKDSGGDYGGVISLVKTGNFVYLCTEFRDFYQIDVSNPAAPRQTAAFDCDDYHSLDVTSRGTTIVLANRDFGLRIFDVSSGDIIQLGTVESLGQIQDCQGAGDYAYAAGYHQGLQILAVTDPRNPVLVNTVHLTGYTNGLFVSGNTVYTAQVDRTANSGGYLEIVDVSDAAAAAVIGSLELPGRPFDVIVDGQTAYVAVQTEGIAVVDVSDPTNPVLVSLFDTAGSCYGLALHGSLLAGADGSKGSFVADARDPAQLKSIAGGLGTGVVQAIAVWETFLFTPGGARGLTVTDISLPGSPATAAELPPAALGFEAMGFKAATAFNSYLLTIETTFASGQVRLFDIADPAQPVALATQRTMYGDPIKITYCPDRQMAYGSCQIAGLFIYSIDAPASAACDVEGRYSGGSDEAGVVLSIDQVRSALTGSITIAQKRTTLQGSFSAAITDDGVIAGAISFDDGRTAVLALTCDAEQRCLSGALSGAVSLEDITVCPAGLRGQLPLDETAALLSGEIDEALTDPATPAEAFLLTQAGSALDDGLVSETLSSLLTGAGLAELYLAVLGPAGSVAAAASSLYTAALWDTDIARAVAANMQADICVDFRDTLNTTKGNADRLFAAGRKLGDNGRHALALRAFSRAAARYEQTIAQYYHLKPDCPDYDIAEFDGFFQGTIDFGFAMGNVRFCVAQDADGAVSGEAIIEIGATGEKMGGRLQETVNETLGDKSVLNGYIQVFVGGTEAHVLMIDWQHNPSKEQWEGAVDVDLQPVNATAAVIKVADTCPEGWAEEFAAVTGTE